MRSGAATVDKQGLTPAQKARKVTRAFKISKSLDDAVILHSDKAGITPSSFLNHLLVQYFDWWEFDTHGSSMLTLDRRLFGSLIEELDEERIADIAKSVALMTSREFIKFRGSRLDTEGILSYLELVGAHMNWGQVTVNRDGGDLEVLVKHDLGIKWSLFLSEFISSLLSSFLAMETSSEFSTFGCSVRARIGDGPKPSGSPTVDRGMAKESGGPFY